MRRRAKTKKAAATRKSRGARKKNRPAAAAPRSAAEERFARDLAVRGEAAALDGRGRLPSHATHVVTEENESGPVVKRARFKLY